MSIVAKMYTKSAFVSGFLHGFIFSWGASLFAGPIGLVLYIEMLSRPQSLVRILAARFVPLLIWVLILYFFLRLGRRNILKKGWILPSTAGVIFGIGLFLVISMLLSVFIVF